MDDCVFCKIVKGEIPTEKKKETENFIVIPDINPLAKVHLLLICKSHIPDLMSINNDLWIEAKSVALELQKELNVNEFQFRINWGKLLGVNHLHAHFLSDFEK